MSRKNKKWKIKKNENWSTDYHSIDLIEFQDHNIIDEMLFFVASQSEEISKIPHLDYSLQPQSSLFNITLTQNFDLSNEYIQSLITFPAILLALGILSLLVFSLILLSRCCFTCSKSQPEEQDIIKRFNGDRHQWANRLSYIKTSLLVTFSFFLIVAFFCNHLQFLVRNYLILIDEWHRLPLN